MSFLLVERGQQAGQRIPLVEFPVTVGRDPANSIPIDDKEISRHHFRIKKRGRIFVIQDLDSRNGTFLNGDRIMNSVIRSGDRILSGNTEFVFVSADSSVNLATEISHLDMVIAEELGIPSPVMLNNKNVNAHQNIVRLGYLEMLDLSAHTHEKVRKVFDAHTNVLLTSDLDEASKSILKSIGQMMPNALRSAIFVWMKQPRMLIPKAARQYKTKKSYQLSKRLFEDAISRKQGVMAQTIAAKNNIQQTVVLPLINQDEVLALVHVETQVSGNDAYSRAEIEMVQAFLARCAVTMDSMILKQELDTWLVGMIETMIATLEAKDTYTHGHSERVSRYSMAIAEELKLSRELKKLLLMSSLCHDIGKIGIPDSILKKASLLSAEEYGEMKLHPSIGAEIVKNMPNAHRFLSGIKHHHERWDGTGYPEGLEGEDIPFFGRIVALADAFDAMVSGRAYSGFFDQADAAQQLSAETDLFDPEVIKAFLKAFEKGYLTIKTATKNNEPKT